MTQKGTVVKIYKNAAYIAVARSSACGHDCASCTGSCTSKTHVVRVINTLGAKPGDTVLLQSDDRAVLRAAFTVYCMPLFLFFSGYGIAYSITEKFSISACFAFVFLVLGFLLLKKLDTRLSPKVKMEKFL